MNQMMAMLMKYNNITLLLIIILFYQLESSASWTAFPTLNQRTKTGSRKSSISNIGVPFKICHNRYSSLPSSSSILFLTSNNDNENLQSAFLGDNAEDDETQQEVIIRGSDSDNIDGSIWEDLETGRPPEIMVMKEVSCKLLLTFPLW